MCLHHTNRRNRSTEATTIAQCVSSCCTSRHGLRLQESANAFSVANAVSANLVDTSKLPFQPEVVETVKQQGWISDEYEHLWRRDEGGSAALTSHGILSMTKAGGLV